MSKKKNKKKNKSWDFPVAKNAKDLTESTPEIDCLDDALRYITNTARSWNKKFVNDELSRIRNTKIISDPFPKHSEYENKYSKENIKKLPYEEQLLLSIFGKPVGPEEISIWKAFRMGYDKAYEEIKNSIGNKELK